MRSGDPAPTVIDATRRIEPETIPLLRRLPRWDVTSVETIRSSYAAVAAPPVPPDPRVTRSDELIAGGDGRADVSVRWYRPVDCPQPPACVVYLHGGGYIMGNLDENDDRLDRIALEHGCAVVSVDWRLAPEHPYPQGLEDAETVWRAVSENPGGFGVDGERLVLAGASAGAGLAASLCLRLRERDLTQPKLQLLVYPMLDDRLARASTRPATGDGPPGMWPWRAEELSWQAYLADLDGTDVPATAAPARAEDLSGVAPAFLAIGDADVYVEANLRFAAKLVGSGVPTELHVYPGVIHGGFVTRPTTPRTQQLLRDVHQALRFALG